ncbi:2'-5' RNA ligase family protein [Brevundimonas sp.]|uniref:2'-5' RNA ligase family protein n=1 Tax=Brevundimonas sp. TaxID=1871086 RepID=UPI002B8170E3|nr:2'-5' RNA ligase family protein [Brevundimonas sp.]HWQ87121.1 2'-5' RNA ligase family protein [Brevundimonas sp.]
MPVLSGDLFGEPASTQIERLFLGVMLPPDAAAGASKVLDETRADHGLKGSPIRQDRLHVTLIHVGDYAGSLPQTVVADIRTAVEGLSEAAFDVAFDRVGSFAGAPGRHPCVLLGGDGVELLRAFRGRLFRALLRAGVRTLSREAFTPHVTLAYGDRRPPERAIDPLGWRPAEFLLVHSEVGRSTYHMLARWPLHG